MAGDAGVICAWTMWQTYGDVALVARHCYLNGHQYQIRGTRGTEPAVVQEARRASAASTAAKDAKMRNK